MDYQDGDVTLEQMRKDYDRIFNEGHDVDVHGECDFCREFRATWPRNRNNILLSPEAAYEWSAIWKQRKANYRNQ